MSIYQDIFTTLAAYARMAEIFMDFDKVIGYSNLAHSDIKRGKVLIRHGILHLWLHMLGFLRFSWILINL